MHEKVGGQTTLIDPTLEIVGVNWLSWPRASAVYETCQVSRISRARESHAFSLNSRISARLNIISCIWFYLPH